MQSNISKYSKPPNNNSQIKENDNIIGYFGKNIYKTNGFCNFLTKYIFILRSEILKI